MTLIEKLELLHKKLIAEELGYAALMLNDIIESAKSEMQEPVAWMYESATEITEFSDGLGQENRYGGFARRLSFMKPKIHPQFRDSIPLFTHPPLSDETVKDAARYNWLISRRLLKGNNLRADSTKEFFASGFIGRGRSLNDVIDEAMKAANETKGA